MPQSVSEAIRQGLSDFTNIRQAKQQQGQQDFTNKLALAKLQAEGYQYDPSRGQLSRSPGYVDYDTKLKQLQIAEKERSALPVDPTQDLVEVQPGMFYSKSQQKYIKSGPETEINFPSYGGMGGQQEEPMYEPVDYLSEQMQPMQDEESEIQPLQFSEAEQYPTYSTPEEADANEAPGTIVMINGARYQV